MKRSLLLVLIAAPLFAQPVVKAIPANIQWGAYAAGAKPVLTIKSGETVRIETASGNPAVLGPLGAPEDDNLRELKEIYAQIKERGPGPHILTGPVAVEGAKPGDVLQVDILSVEPRSTYGYNCQSPVAGILPYDFPVSRTTLIKVDLQARIAPMSPGVRIPLRPFFGSMGLAPASGRVNSAPPGAHAGNLDNKELVAGTTLYIPVQHEGALFSTGDGHLIQGDGEVDLCGLESPLAGVFRLTVRKDMKLLWPRAETPTHVIAMGFHETLDEAARRATREMVEYLVTVKGMTPQDAYSLCSMAVDLRITQVVDGVKGVHAMVPKALFK